MPVQIRKFDPHAFVEKCVAAAAKRPTIKVGSQGEHVRAWQTLMQKEMGAHIAADGMFGHSTQAVTLAFQRKIGLPPDGTVGPKSWAAAAVAACFAGAVQQQQLAARAAHGVGAFDFSFSVLDTKSMVLGVVLGVAAGAVLFRKK